MNNEKLSEADKKALKVIKYHQKISRELNNTYNSILDEVEKSINLTEEILRDYNVNVNEIYEKNTKIEIEESMSIHLRSWSEVSNEAESNIDREVAFHDVLTKSEIEQIHNKHIDIGKAFNSIHHLDGWDWTISGTVGIIAALVDVFLVQVPKHKGFLGSKGHEGGPLSNWMHEHIRNSLSHEEISKLERDNWVPYDAANNKNLNKTVDGLNTRTHRIQSFGHDPILSFIIGVKDILNGQFTAIDKHGNIITQSIDMSKHPEMKGMSIFNAIATVIGHLKSDVATPAGLPAPFMGLLQLIPGEIAVGEKNKIHPITEVVRVMYVKGYNFNHFLAMSIPVMIIEVLLRILYFSKRHWKDGYKIEESVPFGNAPKLQTMLFSSHTIATVANAGKVILPTSPIINPLAINYPQWIMFFKYSIGQLKWTLINKPNQRLKYIQDEIDSDWIAIDDDLNSIFNDSNIKPFIFKNGF